MRTPAPASTAKPSKGGRAPTQVVVHDAGGGKPVTVKLRDTVEIGRGDRCAIRLQDTYVSQVHARLYGKDSSGTWRIRGRRTERCSTTVASTPRSRSTPATS
jgi:pSer/pThr/pTyr-binding forkhead associated (FHA) protein